MRNGLKWFALALILHGSVAHAQTAAGGSGLSSDARHSGWRLRRAVTLGPKASAQHGFAALPLPPELQAAANANWRDLRLATTDAKEESGGDIPYVIHRQAPLAEEDVYEGTLIDTRREPRHKSSFVVSLKERCSFERIELKIDQTDFSKHLNIEAADEPNGPFHLLRSDVGVFDQAWASARSVIIHHTTVNFEGGAAARFLRITVDDSKSRAIELSGLSVYRRRAAPGTFWQQEVAVRPDIKPAMRSGRQLAAPSVSRYRLQVPAGFPVEELEISTDTPTFARNVELFAEFTAASGEAPQRTSLGSGLVYRVAVSNKSASSGEFPSAAKTSLRLHSKPANGTLYLEVQDGDSPALVNLRLHARGTSERLIFPIDPNPAVTTARRFMLYYGNDKTRAPRYDLEALKDRLAQLRQLPLAVLGTEEPNPSYRPIPPLSFVAGVGAPLEVNIFRVSRQLEIPNAEDIYSVTLRPEDLGLVRTDYADLRISDGKGRQVPYVLEADAVESSVVLEVTAAPNSEPSARRSRYRLRYGNGEKSLPLRALELEFADSYYARSVRIMTLAQGQQTDDTAQSSRRHLHRLRPRLSEQEVEEATRLLYFGEISHNVAQDGDAAVHRLALSRQLADQRELILEIDNGDNAALNLRQVRGVVVAPRLSFKLNPEAPPYQLYFGAPNLLLPRYDIERLRELVLNDVALPVTQGPLLQNSAFRPSGSEYMQNAPSALLLWGGLLGTSAILLFLTLRLLKKKTDATADAG